MGIWPCAFLSLKSLNGETNVSKTKLGNEKIARFFEDVDQLARHYVTVHKNPDIPVFDFSHSS